MVPEAGAASRRARWDSDCRLVFMAGCLVLVRRGAGNDVVKPQDIADDRLEGNEGSDVLAGSNGDDELCGVNRKGLVGFLSRCENAACVEGRADWLSRGLSEDLLSGSRRDDVRMKATGRVSS